MNTPENVPPITDMRYVGWDNADPSFKQLFALKKLLQEEGVNPAELYGSGFTSVDHLSRWAASWGIGYLTAAQEARYVEDHRRRLQADAEELQQLRLKRYIASHYRKQLRERG